MGAWIEIIISGIIFESVCVAPYMGAWIEIFNVATFEKDRIVAPYMGAWIEIWSAWKRILNQDESLPTWERGLKSYFLHIEELQSLSLPTWERGLKSQHWLVIAEVDNVAPYMGAWIEIALR